MKKILLSFVTLCLALGAWAQDTYYAEMLSRNNYYGTARSVALGNAMTALGGDLGSVGINPAGAAVNSYCQITITPALLLQNTKSSWSPNGYDNYGSPESTFHAKFNVPNGGINLVLFNDSRSDLRYITLGFVVNTTNSYLNYLTAHGTNDKTSFLGNLASRASNTTGWNSNTYGALYTAFKANQIGSFGGNDSGKFSGSNEIVEPGDRYSYVPGTLVQQAEYNTFGTKSDVIFNMGFNVQDELYLGFNLGLPSTKYRREDIFTEMAQTPVSFPVNFVDKNGNHEGKEGEPTTYYKSSTNQYTLNTEAKGIYGKFGFIWLPVEGLRVGAAIQTPSLLTIKEEWQYRARSYYENTKYNGSWNSDVDDYSYLLRTPYIVDAGLAYTFGGFGLVSLDYELTDYSVMKYSETGFGESEWCRDVNQTTKRFCGVSHSLRAGIEVKPLPEFSLRAGYSLITDPERYAYDLNGNMYTAENWNTNDIVTLQEFRYFKNMTNAYSLGVGYSSEGSFFADAAVRLTSYPKLYYAPYYYGEYDAVDKNGMLLDAGSPDIAFNRSVFDILLTIGWRF